MSKLRRLQRGKPQGPIGEVGEVSDPHYINRAPRIIYYYHATSADSKNTRARGAKQVVGTTDFTDYTDRCCREHPRSQQILCNAAGRPLMTSLRDMSELGPSNAFTALIDRGCQK
jgi:hypothetical protein